MFWWFWCGRESEGRRACVFVLRRPRAKSVCRLQAWYRCKGRKEKKFIVQNRNKLALLQPSLWNVSAEDVISLRCPSLNSCIGAVLALSWGGRGKERWRVLQCTCLLLGVGRLLLRVEATATSQLHLPSHDTVPASHRDCLA